MNLTIQNNLIENINNSGYRSEISLDFVIKKEGSIKEYFLLYIYLEDMEYYEDNIIKHINELLKKDNLIIKEYDNSDGDLYEISIIKTSK